MASTSNIPTAQADERQLKVLAAGPGRTGTQSVQARIKVSFGPCYRMREIGDKYDCHVALWMEAEKSVRLGKEVNFSRIFIGDTVYVSAVDYPAVTFFPEIFRLNPDGTVVLSHRNSLEVWAESVEETICNVCMVTSLSIVRFFGSLTYRICKFIWVALWRHLWATVWGHPRALYGKCNDRDYLIAVNNRRSEEVMPFVPEKQLVVFNVKKGLEPLMIRLLAVEAPDQPFPRSNARAALKGATKDFILKSVAPVVAVVAVGCGLWCGMWFVVKQ